MIRNRFAATRLTPAQAHEVWQRSDEATAFTRPDYLAQLVDEVEWWGVERSGEIVAAWPLVRALAGGEIAPPPFCYYVGPMFARSLREDKYLRYWTAYTEIFSALIEAIVDVHSHFRFSMPVGLTDVRPFEWWNFDHPGHAAFTIRPRHTAYIDLAAFSDETELFQSFARDRRRHIRRWTEAPPPTITQVPPERIVALHDQALARSGTAIAPERHQALKRMLALVHGGAGCILGFIPPGAQDVEAAIVILDGLDDANDVMAVSSDEWRDQGLGAWAVWQGLLRSHARGKRYFDFNGANSPGRAADKHFYGAEARLYFNCEFGSN